MKYKVYLWHSNKGWSLEKFFDSIFDAMDRAEKACREIPVSSGVSQVREVGEEYEKICVSYTKRGGEIYEKVF